MADYRPLVPAFDRAADLWTFKDAYEHVLDTFDNAGGSTTGRTPRNARGAVLEAYRDIPSHHQWSSFYRRGQVTTVAPQETGSVAYDHTGGAYERMVTLTDATWPTDIRYYRVLIDGVTYKVEDRKSSTIITLTQDSNPGADVASGTTYEAFRSAYPLPVGFRRMCSKVLDLNGGQWMEYLEPDEWMGRQWFENETSTPLYYTFRSGGEHYAGMVIEFGPAPYSAVTYDFMYEASPRPIRLFGGNVEYSTGTVANSSTTITGTGTAWTSEMVGAVIRFSTDSATPTGIRGDRPFAEQRIIQAVGGATSLTIDTALSGTYSGDGYTISDPLDMDASMLTYLLILAESKYTRLANHKLDQVKARTEAARMALAEAKIADNRQRDLQSSQAFWSYRDVHISED